MLSAVMPHAVSRLFLRPSVQSSLDISQCLVSMLDTFILVKLS